MLCQLQAWELQASEGSSAGAIGEWPNQVRPVCPAAIHRLPDLIADQFRTAISCLDRRALVEPFIERLALQDDRHAVVQMVNARSRLGCQDRAVC